MVPNIKKKLELACYSQVRPVSLGSFLRCQFRIDAESVTELRALSFKKNITNNGWRQFLDTKP